MNKFEIAEILDQAAKHAKATQQLAADNEVSLEDAYEIQRLSIDKRLKRGEKVTGFKLGFTSRAKMEQMGVHDLIWGFLTDDMEIAAKGTTPLSKYIHPRVEPEIAFRVSEDITEAIGLKDIHKYIDKMAPALEIIDSRYENFKFSLEDVVADNCSSTGYVIGEWQDLDADITDLDIELYINNELKANGKSAAILNNPLVSVVELSRLASKAEIEIKKGMVILAGAATAAVYLNENETIETKIEKLGSVSFRVQ
ncbi:2-keto-4-pentenoate hydratase [Mesonia sp. K7]|uniref:2-keto-4-pentenoate hydratase n=1 Tax=Mesonia sp. K7 TaxID=2218606 RepID=UPI000DAA1D41|nr:fumarylacetoacetate hydrolase family protein [Mesonia sp. K7]PZD79667.1 4-oxalocrotonate decarboxylase [Mesonia sp. K7]